MEPEQKTENEVILREENMRFTLFPIKYHDLYELGRKQLAMFWSASDFKYNEDRADWAKLNEDEQYFIKHILAFFAGSDGIVLENLMSRFSSDVKIQEARYFYAMQGAIEMVHSETYSLLIDTFISDVAEKNRLFDAIETIPAVAKKAGWALKWAGSDAPFAQRLIAFVVVEGLFFSGSFCSIFWLAEKHLMKQALCASNIAISRDEALHVKFGTTLFKYIKNRPSVEIVHGIFQEAMEIEAEFITSSLPCALIGMNSDKMIEYVKFVANTLLEDLGYPILFANCTCPFGFMEKMALENKTAFFEKVNSDYRKFEGDASELDFDNLDEDF